MKQHFQKLHEILSLAEAEVVVSISKKEKSLDDQEKKVAQQRRAVATRSKNLKDKEDGFDKKFKEVEAGLKRIRKDDELTKLKNSINERMAIIEAKEKDVAQREDVVDARLVEIVKREKALLVKKREYKKQLEQEIVDRFLKK